MYRFTLCVTVWMMLSHNCCTQICTYEKYFYWCYAANFDYASNLLEKANHNYKIAFKSVDFPLGTDVSSALEVAREVQDTNWAYCLAIVLAKGGVPIEYFKDYEEYSWFSQFTTEYPVYTIFYQDHFDQVLKDQFLQLCLKDSIFNAMYHEWRTGDLEMTLTQLIEGAMEILDSLKYLTHHHGFPCEQKMGYFYHNFEIKQFPIVPLLIHIYQRGELFYRDRLSSISCDGKLRPIEVAGINKYKGFGNSTGVEQEMRIRWEKYRGRK